jgi:23S rRNA (pseudouridine1915-N3)-methyltransferase
VDVKIVIVAVGRLKEPEFRTLTDGYIARVRRHFPVEEFEVADGPASVLTDALARHARGANIVALEAAGRELDSPAFASELERLGRTGKGDIAFVIGGKAGLPRDVLERATVTWSLSRLTFPHRLARLVLIEQLYRATAILRNEPYAH